MMMQNLWEFSHEFDDPELYKYFEGESPPPPYSAEDLLKEKSVGRKSLYTEVGEEIYIKISKKPNELIGLTVLSGQSFKPSWPTILDIKIFSPASQSELQIGDQIKELYGIPTETLTHSQVLALFSKATDQIVMTVKRGVEPSDRTFYWYKYPFSTVNKTYEDMLVHNVENNMSLTGNLCDKEELFQTFKYIDDYESKKLADIRNENRKKNEGFILKHRRTLSANNTSKDNFLSTRQRRRTTDHTNKYDSLSEKYNLMAKSPVDGGKLIAKEIEEITSNQTNKIPIHCDSQSSLASTVSASTVSSFSSCSTVNEQVTEPHRHWMDQVVMDTKQSDNIFDNSSHDNFKNAYISPVHRLRNSFRRKKQKLKLREEENGEEKSILTYVTNEDTILATVWIADCKRLGLKLGGGSVSLYGDSNISVLEVRKHGTLFKLFRVGDEILEIDGTSTNGMDVYETNSVISKLEGNYVEFKIFRPSHKS